MRLHLGNTLTSSSSTSTTNININNKRIVHIHFVERGNLGCSACPFANGGPAGPGRKSYGAVTRNLVFVVLVDNHRKISPD